MLEEKENELGSEKKNALKRDKTIQGLTQVLREKEKEVKLRQSSTVVLTVMCLTTLSPLKPTDLRTVS